MAEDMKNDLDRFKRRLIRVVSKYKTLYPDSYWPKVEEVMGKGSKNMWILMHSLTIKKMQRHLMALDLPTQMSPSARMTLTDWLMVDMVLVHENINTVDVGSNETVMKQLEVLFKLCSEHGIENASKEELAMKWIAVSSDYNRLGRRCSPMLLQRRWYDMKAQTRSKFYQYWQVFWKADRSEEIKPNSLNKEIATRYPELITAPFKEWKTLLEEGKIILPAEFERLMEEKIKKKKAPSVPEVDDVVLIEPQIETIDIDVDSDKEEGLTAIENKVKQGVQEKNVNMSNSQIVTKNRHEAMPETTSSNCKTEMETQGDAVDRTNIEIKRNNELDNIKTNEKSNNESEEIEITDSINEETLSQCVINENIDSISPNLMPMILKIETLAPQKQLEEIASDPKINVMESIKSNSVKNLETPARDKEMPIPQSETNTLEPQSETSSLESSFNKKNTDGDNERLSRVAEIDECDVEFADDENDIIDLETIKSLQQQHENLVKVEKDENVDEDTSFDDESRDCQKFDLKLLMLPVVYTQKLDDMKLLKNIPLNATICNKEVDLNTIEEQSKPKSKEFNLNCEDVDVNCAENDTDVSSDYGEYIDMDETPLVKETSYLFRKPKVRTYTPINLCKNPDFNTRLRRLSATFLMTPRNRQLLKSLKPLTVDMHKIFEDKLVNGTIRVKKVKHMSDNGCITIADFDRQSTNIVPSVMPVQSLIDKEQVNLNILVPPKTIPEDTIFQADENNTTNNTTEVPSSEIIKPHSGSCVTEVELLRNRHNKILLPDLEKVREVNKHLKTAQVQPLTKNSHETADTWNTTPSDQSWIQNNLNQNNYNHVNCDKNNEIPVVSNPPCEAQTHCEVQTPGISEDATEKKYSELKINLDSVNPNAVNTGQKNQVKKNSQREQPWYNARNAKVPVPWYERYKLKPKQSQDTNLIAHDCLKRMIISLEPFVEMGINKIPVSNTLERVNFCCNARRHVVLNEKRRHLFLKQNNLNDQFIYERPYNIHRCMTGCPCCCHQLYNDWKNLETLRNCEEEFERDSDFIGNFNKSLNRIKSDDKEEEIYKNIHPEDETTKAIENEVNKMAVARSRKRTLKLFKRIELGHETKSSKEVIDLDSENESLKYKKIKKKETKIRQNKNKINNKKITLKSNTITETDYMQNEQDYQVLINTGDAPNNLESHQASQDVSVPLVQGKAVFKIVSNCTEDPIKSQPVITVDGSALKVSMNKQKPTHTSMKQLKPQLYSDNNMQLHSTENEQDNQFGVQSQKNIVKSQKMTINKFKVFAGDISTNISPINEETFDENSQQEGLEFNEKSVTIPPLNNNSSTETISTSQNIQNNQLRVYSDESHLVVSGDPILIPDQDNVDSVGVMEAIPTDIPEKFENLPIGTEIEMVGDDIAAYYNGVKQCLSEKQTIIVKSFLSSNLAQQQNINKPGVEPVTNIQIEPRTGVSTTLNPSLYASMPSVNINISLQEPTSNSDHSSSYQMAIEPVGPQVDALEENAICISDNEESMKVMHPVKCYSSKKLSSRDTSGNSILSDLMQISGISPDDESQSIEKVISPTSLPIYTAVATDGDSTVMSSPKGKYYILNKTNGELTPICIMREKPNILRKLVIDPMMSTNNTTNNVRMPLSITVATKNVVRKSLLKRNRLKIPVVKRRMNILPKLTNKKNPVPTSCIDLVDTEDEMVEEYLSDVDSGDQYTDSGTISKRKRINAVTSTFESDSSDDEPLAVKAAKKKKVSSSTIDVDSPLNEDDVARVLDHNIRNSEESNNEDDANNIALDDCDSLDDEPLAVKAAKNNVSPYGVHVVGPVNEHDLAIVDDKETNNAEMIIENTDNDAVVFDCDSRDDSNIDINSDVNEDDGNLILGI